MGRAKRASIALAMLLAAALLSMAAAPASAQGAVHVVTYIELQAAETKNGMMLLKQYREAARKEGGNLEAEMGQEIGRANRFVLIEGWRDQSAFDAHEKADA